MRKRLDRDLLEPFYDEAIGFIQTSRDARVGLWLSLVYAIRLFESGAEADLARAREMLARFLDTQCRAPGDKEGVFAMCTDGRVGDLNSNHFQMPWLLTLYTKHREAMGADLRERFEDALRLGMTAAERRWDVEVFDLHRDFAAYSNIFVMYVRSLVWMAETFDDVRLRETARGQWRRWFHRVAYYGVEEFCSPTYNQVVTECLLEILEVTSDASIRREARLVLDHLVALQLAIHHPLLKVPLCGMARDYRRYLGIEKRPLGVVIDPDEYAGGEPGLYDPPEEVVEEFRGSAFPRAARGRATPVPFRFRSWQAETAGVGSMTGGNYFPQQVHWIAAAGKSPEERAVALVPGGASLMNGYVCQRENRALLVANRLPNTYLRCQARRRDDEIADMFGPTPYALGLTDAWDVTGGRDGDLAASAYGWTLRVRPFVLHAETGETEPAALERDESTAGLRQFVFPKEAAWFGAHLALEEGAGHEARNAVSAARRDREVAVASEDGLGLRLFLHPSGECTELYDDDPRAAPLFEGPCGTLAPGDLLKASIRETE